MLWDGTDRRDNAATAAMLVGSLSRAIPSGGGDGDSDGRDDVEARQKSSQQGGRVAKDMMRTASEYCQ